MQYLQTYVADINSFSSALTAIKILINLSIKLNYKIRLNSRLEFIWLTVEYVYVIIGLIPFHICIERTNNLTLTLLDTTIVFNSF